MLENKKKMKELIVTWRIENISYTWHKTGECIVSPVFYAGPLQNTAWTLKLYPRGINDGDFFSFSVDRQKDQVPLNFLINLELSCLSKDKSVLNSSLILDIINISANCGQSEFGESCFIKRSEVFEERKALYLPKDILTLRCRMWGNDGDTCEFAEIFAHTQLITKRVISVQYIDSLNNYENNFIIGSECKHLVLIDGKVAYLGDKLNIIFNSINPAGIKFGTCKSSFTDRETGAKLCEHAGCLFAEFPRNLRWLLSIDKRLLKENNVKDTSKFEFILEIIYAIGKVKNTIEQHPPRRFLELVSKCIGGNGCNCRMRNCAGIGVDLWNLYIKQDFCDVELKTQNKSLFVHEVVLCARSPVFLAMLTCEMKEKIKRCIKIEDIRDINLEIFIEFLYTDLFEGIDWDAAIELYYVAVKYQIKRLRFLCCGYLMENVSNDKVYELLILAERHNDYELKRKLEDFVWENESTLIQTSSWKKFAREHQQLAQTLLSVCREKENFDFNEIWLNLFRNPAYNVLLSKIPSIKDDFRSLFEGHIATDVVVKTANATFPAHKTILCASSSIFKDWFRIDSGDKPIDFLEIENWEDDTILRMLIFLYSDSLENIQWDTAMKLYQLARAHEIRRLQIECSCFLLERLSVTNASHLLLLAHEHRDVALKSVVEDYICQYDEEIFRTDEWGALCKNNTKLAFTTMSAKYTKNK